MSKRREISEALNRLAFARELLGEDERLAKILASGAWSLQKAGDLEALHAAGELASAGLSAPVRKVVEAVLDDQPVPKLAELEAKIPAGLLEVRKVRGLGAKKIRKLWQELGITSLAELEYACNENRLIELDGFGPKTQAKVLEGIAEVRRHAGRWRLDVMLERGDQICAALRALTPSIEANVVGQVHRGFETVDRLELVALAGPELETHLHAELTKLGAEDLSLDSSSDGCPQLSGTIAGAPLVIGLAAEQAVFGLTLVHRSSDEEHWRALVHRASKQALRLSPLALEGPDGPLPVAKEEDLYEALDLWPTPPERREAGVPLVPAGDAPPRLVRLEDLQGALHNHTTASDGTSSLEEMAAAATAAGLSYLGITEHSQTAAYAGGLDAAALERERELARRLDADARGCRIFYGIESDILADGALDYAPEVLATLDLVVASVHQRHSQNAEAMTQRMVRAAQNPWTDIIGHPTGRLLLGRDPAPVDVEALLEACASSGCAVELNANPARLDLCEQHLSLAKERGVLVSIAADAHSAVALDHLAYGITIARRAGLGPDDVLNTRSYEEMARWLEARKARARDLP